MITVNRTLLTLLFVGLIFLAGYINGCACNRARQVPSKNDTVTIERRDTAWIPLRDTVRQYVPVPQMVYKAGPPRVDSFIAYEREVVRDTVRVLGDYYAKVFYRDPILTPYGTITIEDTVTQNRIAARSAILDLRVPHTVEYRSVPKKNQVWVGLQTFYTPYTGQVAVGSSLEFLHKRGLGLEVFGSVDTRGVGTVGVGGKYLIKLRNP